MTLRKAHAAMMTMPWAPVVIDLSIAGTCRPLGAVTLTVTMS